MSATDVAARLERLLGAEAVRASAMAAPFDALPLASPASDEGLLEVLRLASSDGLRVLPLGFGSKLGWCPVVPRAPDAPDSSGEGLEVDLLLSTRRLAGVVAFEPGDGTLTARAGSPMAELARTVEEDGLSLTPAVPTPTAATLGGVLAAGQSGVDRLCYGPARHHVLGMRVALADGTLARTGGRLVKNVTGFDLHRLYCGSHGTLCVLLEATLRLFPLPQAMVALRARPADVVAALEAARALGALPIRPWTVLIDHDAEGTELSLVLAGREEVVAWETERALEVLPDAELVRDRAARELAHVLCDRELERGAWPHVRVPCRPSRLDEVFEHWHPRCARIRLQPALAVLDAWLTEPPPTTPGTPVSRPRVERPPLPEAATRTMDALRARLDPRGVFAPRVLP